MSLTSVYFWLNKYIADSHVYSDYNFKMYNNYQEAVLFVLGETQTQLKFRVMLCENMPVVNLVM